MMVKANKNQNMALTPCNPNKSKKAKRTSTTTSSVVVSPTSPVAMGKALVLIATSCAALSTHPRGCVKSQPTRRTDGYHRCIKSKGAGNRSHNQSHGQFHQFHSALHYRDGDEDQSAEMRAAVDEATGTATAAKRATPPPPPRQQQQQHFNPLTFTLASMSIPRMPSMPSMPAYSHPPSKEDAEQLVMDEYLQFVEKRYTRMHPSEHNHHHNQNNHRSSASKRRRRIARPRVLLDLRIPRKIFLSTLALHGVAPLTIKPTMPPKPSTTIATASAPREQQQAQQAHQQEEEEEEDPLNVLGLSSLASPGLRRRLHVPRDLRDEAALLASSRERAVEFVTYCVNTGRPLVHAHAAAPGVFLSAVVAPKTQKKVPKTTAEGEGEVFGPRASSAPAAELFGRASPFVALSLPAQLRLLASTLGRLVRAFAGTVRLLAAFGKRAFEEILDKGGFRNTVRLAGAMSVAVLLMFRPLFGGALKQG